MKINSYERREMADREKHKEQLTNYLPHFYMNLITGRTIKTILEYRNMDEYNN